MRLVGFSFVNFPLCADLDRNDLEGTILHDDVTKWKYFPRYWPFVRGFRRSPVNSPHKGQWRGALLFSLIFAWINRWVNNREAGDSRSHHAHYDVFVMSAGDPNVSISTRPTVATVISLSINSSTLVLISSAKKCKDRTKQFSNEHQKRLMKDFLTRFNIKIIW